MPIIEVALAHESQSRYLTYALSVVSSRALPDVRDGLKPVQRRILYAMLNNLNLTPDRHYRKSAAVVGEVLARYHPHGDSACYEAMVRMAQDFNFRYPLVDGQGNFGSLDGDSAAAYRYTEARLTTLALEVLGDLGEATVPERDNFDQTVKEPAVLPSRVPNLLVNGAAGIAVGMATSIPPHNLGDVIKALLLMLADPDVSDRRLVSAVKGPDFPTGCQVLNTADELLSIYTTGRGPIRMRGDYMVEKQPRAKDQIVITSIPYTVDKSVLVQRIADLIIARKITQLTDVRDESTDEVRVVLEMNAGSDPDKVMAYLFKHTPLQQNFNVNMTALVPTINPLVGRPVLCSLREMLRHFLEFRVSMIRSRLEFERGKLADRVHVLEGLILVNDVMDEVIDIVRKSDGRADAAARLRKRFKLSEVQALFIVDLRIYQLSRTSVVEIETELKSKASRIAAIDKILKTEAGLKGELATELERISNEYGDKRRSKIIGEFEEVVVSQEEYLEHEDVHVIISKDGWLKRIRQTNDPESARLREGDSLAFTYKASTRDLLAIFSSAGNAYVTKVFDLPATTGFGDPVQKLFKFGDEEQIVGAIVMPKEGTPIGDIVIVTERGLGFRTSADALGETKKGGRKLARLVNDDTLKTVIQFPAKSTSAFLLSEQGFGLLLMKSEIPELNAPAKGVILQKLGKDDRIAAACAVAKDSTVHIQAKTGVRDIAMRGLTIGSRGAKGEKVTGRAGTVLGLAR